MVATLKGLLVGETGLLEQVNDHVGSGQLSGRIEVDPDELPKPGRVVVPHASRTGLVWTILSSRDASPSFLFPEEQMVAK